MDRRGLLRRDVSRGGRDVAYPERWLGESDLLKGVVMASWDAVAEALRDRLRVARYPVYLERGILAMLAAMDKMTTEDYGTAKDYIATLDEQVAEDSKVLLEMMRRISGHEPKMWNAGTIGFDAYHYKYDSGREGDCYIIGFYPRKGKITVYLMDGTARYSELLAELGRHTTTGYCLYIRRLSEVELPVLERILRKSYEHIKSIDGHISKILWKTE